MKSFSVKIRVSPSTLGEKTGFLRQILFVLVPKNGDQKKYNIWAVLVHQNGPKKLCFLVKFDVL